MTESNTQDNQINEGEYYLPNAADAMLADPEYANEMQHGVDVYFFPSDTLDEIAQRETHHLASNPSTAFILTNDHHSMLLGMQHWIRKGYYVADSSVIVCREHLQSIQLYRPL